ncbi:N-6 DNA methylase [Brucella sp. NBRC 12950]|uniref:Eco57I restriction-modification methylase domain-containing protein n=1 Tax=Brucella sp. NBRC 12950 TaxID=2994518 RepID=UPI0024A02A40|nr:N-6 DNA methylase [Brucella sp. NBRC 12950]GLU28016.1 hypothetical protein Brsp01_32490 [Brucella sp. NBRC 12950]
MAKFDPTARRTELIRQITDNQRVAAGKIAEAQSYAPARELLIDPRLGLGIPANSIVVDAPVPFGRERPDIQIWLDGVPVALRNEGEHLFAILELKSGSKVRTGGRSIARSELATYNYSKLRHFYLADGEVIQRYDLGGPSLPQAWEVEWNALADEQILTAFFAPITEDRRSLRRQLEEFSGVEVPLGRKIADLKDRRRFIDAMVTVARILSRAVDELVDARLVPDLRQALEDVATLSNDYGYGTASFDFGGEVDPVGFANEPDQTDFDAVGLFNERYTRMLSDIEPRLYALRAEKVDLPSYAMRSGLDVAYASFLRVNDSNKKAKEIAVSARTSFVQETSALLFSRLLMVRFSEDNGLLPRVLSNGGLAAFASFAKHSSEPFQLLIRTAYDKARRIYRHLFEKKPLDWLLDGEDAGLSDALLHAMWILAGWDFTTVRGDILSGIYDRNLDRSQRQALGEVYTRPELAAYMLSSCGYNGTQDVLDPACGSGTFLVEAFEVARQRKEDAGLDFTPDDAIEALERLHGLDLNAFSATLAQIQLLWHALAGTTSNGGDLMRKAIVSLSVEGGHSSLSTWGVSMHEDLFGGRAGRANDEIRANARAGTRRLRTADRKFRDLSGRRGGYPIVAGNPPYVRFERAPIGAEERAEFAPVLKKNTDLSVLFVYRAMEWWLAPGGRLGFFLPLAISEASYAEPLRAILARYRIIEIIDLEEIGNVAFHGANVVTIGLVMEKTPATAQDKIKITRVVQDCLDEELGQIDMSRAITDIVPRSAVLLGRYLPGSSLVASELTRADICSTQSDTMAEAEVQLEPSTAEPLQDDFGSSNSAIDAEIDEEDEENGAGSSDTAWLTKIRSADVEILDRLARSRRLEDIILRGWTKKTYRQKTRYEANIPSGESRLLWQRQPVMGYGVKLGRKSIDNHGGLPVHKAKSLPPDGSLSEAPFGHWNGDPAEVDTARFYSWKGVGDEANTFVVRNIATQPVFAPHPKDAYLTNTVYCIRLSERFPLNIWSLSRVIAWFMAKTARTSVVQGYFATFYPRETTRMPIPAERSGALLDELDEIGLRILGADDELARGDTEVEQLRAGIGSRQFRNRLDLVSSGVVTAPKDISWPRADADWTGAKVDIAGDDIRFLTTDDEGAEEAAPTETGQPCIISIKNSDLLEWIASEARSLLARGNRPDRQWMGSLAIPEDPAAAATIVRRLQKGTAKVELMRALDALDAIVARTLGLSDNQLARIHEAFATDAMLQHVRPQWKHRRAIISEHEG